MRPEIVIKNLPVPITRLLRRQLWAILLVSLNFSVNISAQPTSAPPLDPLLQLMISQPVAEIATNVSAAAICDPPVIHLGEKSTYRITFNAVDDTVELPEKIAAPSPLQLRLAARGQIMTPVNNQLQPKTAINYRVSVSAAGSYVIPAFPAQVSGRSVIVPAAQLEVLPPSADAAPAGRFTLQLSATNVCLGQHVKARAVMSSPGPNLIQPLVFPRLNGDGFLAEQNATRQTISATSTNGRTVTTYTFETELIPLVAGELAVSAQGFAVNSSAGQPADYVLVDSDPSLLAVHPLPAEGRLPGFRGAIGQISCLPPLLSTNQARVGDLIKLTVTFRSNADLDRFVPPPPPDQNQWQIFDSIPTGTPALPPGTPPGAYAAFVYTLIPLTDQATTTPAIPFSCFDPDRGVYVDLTIPPAPIRILPALAKEDAETWPDESQHQVIAEKKPALSGLAASPGLSIDRLVTLPQRGWFILLQFLPLAGFAGLWFWDWRRRFVEQHPEVVLRRRAKRRLRRASRELRKAFHAGNAAAFSRAAISALRFACAPHYPAEPQALVCVDVLQLLSEREQGGSGGAAVRQLFDAADASQFAGKTADDKKLLALQPDLQRVLESLEEQL